MSINCLPDEVLTQILELMSGREMRIARQVCRRWAFIIAGRVIDVTDKAALADLAAAPRRLQVLQVSVAVDFLHQLLRGAARLSPRLRELTVLAPSPLSNEHTRSLPAFPRLTHLDVFSLSRRIDFTFTPIARQLETLVINETVSAGFLTSLCSTNKLTQLHMYGRAQLYPPREMKALLRARGMYFTDLTLRCAELQDRAYALIADCVNLKSLKLYSCWLLRRDAALKLASLRNLKTLHVTGARMLRRLAMHDFLSTIADNLLELVLSATAFSDEHVPVLTNQLPNLRVVELWRTPLTVDGAIALVSNLSDIRELDCDINFDVSDLYMLSKCENLERLRCVTPFYECKARCEREVAFGVWMVNGVRVVEARAGAGCGGARGGGEGPRSALFHYSLQDEPDEPLHPAKRFRDAFYF